MRTDAQPQWDHSCTHDQMAIESGVPVTSAESTLLASRRTNARIAGMAGAVHALLYLKRRNRLFLTLSRTWIHRFDACIENHGSGFGGLATNARQLSLHSETVAIVDTSGVDCASDHRMFYLLSTTLQRD